MDNSHKFLLPLYIVVFNSSLINFPAVEQRNKYAFAALRDAINYLSSDGDIAIFDATNSTVARRQALRAMIRESNSSIGIVSIESCCSDEDILKVNFLHKIKTSPDFRDMPKDEALADLKCRIAKYKAVYEVVNLILGYHNF